MKATWKRAAFAAAVLCALAWAPGARAGAAAEQRRSFDVSRLELHNLIGRVSVTGHDGSGFEVLVRPAGQDAREGVPEVVVVENGDRAELTIRFPTSQSFVYPELGPGASTRFDPEEDRDRSWLDELVHDLFGKQVRVYGSGSGLEVWADVEIRVPRDGSLVVRHGVGSVTADRVAAELDLEIHAGHIEAHEIDGALSAESGSGAVEVARVAGKLSVATGSGPVGVRDARGPSARVATGSGHVNLERIDADSLHVATGSGGVEALEIGAGEATVATGSGEVSLQFARMGSGPFSVATGSGRVALVVPKGASMDVHAETGGGRIDLDLEGEMTMTRHEPDEVAFTIGGGDARVRIGTGSGGIRIAHGG